MKKNKMMRIASVLLVAVLISTCAISGTFAKYVTTTTGTDTARVAKWGVTLTAESDELFLTSYDKGATNATVVSSTTDNVVAPGTKSADGAFKYTVAGTPEVDFKLALAFDADSFKTVVLKAGTYNDPTGLITGGEFTLAEDYYPVEFTLKVGTTTYTFKKLADLTNGIADVTFEAGTAANLTVELSWEWKFEQTNLSLYDAADTYLGNETTPQTINFDLALTATQID